jgi:hypothetical protein
MRIAWPCLLFAAAACTETANEPELATTSSSSTSGALVKMHMHATTGVLLDDLPKGTLRDAAATEALARNTQFWIDKATRQARLTYYKLVFRGQYYAKGTKGPLPLPPKDVWHVTLTSSPVRGIQDGHDYVSVAYDFDTYIVTDDASPAAVEPKLAKIGGTWTEPFVLPIDPDLLLERTGYACMDENEYPAGSVFEENTWYFYDNTCKVETPATSSCHITQFPGQACTDSLTTVGRIQPQMVFTRVAYDTTLAAQYRSGGLHNTNGADLAVVQDGLDEEKSIFYRYFSGSSCEIAEGVVGGTGWRRLLTFSAIVRNDGTEAVHIGDPYDQTNPWVQANAFVFSQCHNHYHFTHYGQFDYSGAPGAKRAFCLEDTDRFHNDEQTPLTAAHQTCNYQGIGPGWGDEYEFGIPGQWVDITGVDTTHGGTLSFHSNPDAFLCEGQPLSSTNQPQDPFDLANIAFDFTGTYTPDGKPISKMRCGLPSNWNDNNLGTTQVTSPGGSFVTDACTRGQSGPNADCGFAADALHACTPGQVLNLTCSSSGAPQVFRACHESEVLGVGTACTVRDSLANALVTTNTPVTFTCPAILDSTHGAGGFAAYHAPAVTSLGGAAVTCTGW